MIKEFINRKKDLENFNILLDTIEGNKNNIIILHANSGIGKSSFTNKLLEDTKEYIPIKVSLPSADYESEEFIRQIAIQIDHTSEENSTVLSMKNFIKKSMPSESENRHNTNIMNALLSSPGLRIFKSIKVIVDRNLASGEYSSNSILLNQDDSFRYIIDYIETNLSQNKIFLVIENIQAIDRVSLNTLSKILQNTFGNKIILEYTNDSKNKNFEIHDIENILRGENSTVKKEHLTILPLSELIEYFIDNKEAQEFKALTDKLYIGYDGNLRRFEDLIAYYIQPEQDQTIINSNEHPTVLRVKSLSKSLQFIICLVIAHRSYINLNILRYLYEFNQTIQNEIFDLDRELEKINGDFITLYNNNVSIKHDYIKDEILGDEYFERYLIIGYQMWSDYYYNLYTSRNINNMTMQDLTNNLFYFFYQSDSKKIFTILEDIKKIAINSIYPDDATLYLEKIRNNVTENNEQEYNLINYSLFDIYYYLGIFEKCYDILQKITEPSLKKSIYQVAILDRLDKHQDALSEIDKILKRNPQSNHLLALNIFKMISLRSLNKIKEAEKIFNNCLNNNEFKDLYEYGFLLRNSEIFLSYTDSIVYLEKSSYFFHTKEKYIYEGHSRVALAMNYARIGQLDKAYQQIIVAETLLENDTLEKFIYLVDKAVILLYTDFEKNVEQAIGLLKRSLRFSVTNFDKIAIYNNLLICYTYLGEENNAFEVVDILHSLLLEQPDVVAHRITYFNISYFYKKFYNLSSYNKYIEKAKSIESVDDTVFWNQKLFKHTTTNTTEYDFLLQFDFDLFYLTYWHFDISQLQ